MADIYNDVSVSTRSKLAILFEGDGDVDEVTDNLAYDGSVAVSDFSAATQFEFLSESLTKQEPMQYNGGIRGTRSKNHERVRKSAHIVQGSIEMTPTPAELDKIFYWTTGTSPSPYALLETVPTVAIIVDRTAQRFMYTGCKIAQLSIGGQQGGLIRAQMTSSESKRLFPPVLFRLSRLTTKSRTCSLRQCLPTVEIHTKSIRSRFKLTTIFRQTAR